VGEAAEYVSIMEPRDAVAAEVARGLLESEGIPVVAQSYQVPWYNGIMTAAVGAWGRILVPAHLSSAAEEILAAYFAGGPGEELDAGEGPA